MAKSLTDDPVLKNSAHAEFKFLFPCGWLTAPYHSTLVDPMLLPSFPRHLRLHARSHTQIGICME